MLPTARCPCQSGRRYKRCCQPLHDGRPAADPEALMRSRYSAYALGLVDYVIDTTDPAGPQWRTDRAAWAADVRDFCRLTSFSGLRVLDADGRDDEGFVMFEARLAVGDRDASFGEHSRFRRVGGRWLYHSAV